VLVIVCGKAVLVLICSCGEKVQLMRNWRLQYGFTLELHVFN